MNARVTSLVAVAATAALSLLGASPVVSDEAGCRPEELMLDAPALTRAASLDLRGVPPTIEELEQATGQSLDEATVNEWIDTPEFASQVVRRHREFFWPNIGNLRFVDPFRALRTVRGTGTAARPTVLGRSQATLALTQRGELGRMCDVADADRATLDANGYARFRMEGELRIDGWVEVAPYWAPSTTVRVCAFDAQTARFSRDGVDCSSQEGRTDPSCGCGPNLEWCTFPDVEQAIIAGLVTDFERRIAANVANDEPYTELFRAPRAYVNGALVRYYRQFAKSSNGLVNWPSSIDASALPDLPYGTDNWTEIQLPPQHAGLLTSPVYLARFQTNRARASHFYDSFLCQPFQPPAGGIPVVQSEVRQPDVQQREGCRYCHSTLEPAAAHWGRWAQLGTAFLSPDRFPVMNPICADCARGEESCPSDCTHYVTRAYSVQEQPFLGELQVYEFLRPEHRSGVDSGPYSLVLDGLRDGRFTRCAVDRTTEWLLGAAVPRESREHQEFVDAFVASGLRYRALVEAIVTSDAYRRVR